MKQLLRWGILILAVTVLMALAKKPDAIDIIFGIPPCTAAMVNQARELGYTGPILSPVIPGDANVVNAMLTPQYAYNFLASGPDVLSDKMTPRVQNLREKEFVGSYGSSTWGAYQDVFGNKHCGEPPAMITTYNNGTLEFEWLK